MVNRYRFLSILFLVISCGASTEAMEKNAQYEKPLFLGGVRVCAVCNGDVRKLIKVGNKWKKVVGGESPVSDPKTGSFYHERCFGLSANPAVEKMEGEESQLSLAPRDKEDRPLDACIERMAERLKLKFIIDVSLLSDEDGKLAQTLSLKFFAFIYDASGETKFSLSDDWNNYLKFLRELRPKNKGNRFDEMKKEFDLDYNTRQNSECFATKETDNDTRILVPYNILEECFCHETAKMLLDGEIQYKRLVIAFLFWKALCQYNKKCSKESVFMNDEELEAFAIFIASKLA